MTKVSESLTRQLAFKKAYERGEISKVQYEQAVAYEKQRLEEAMYKPSQPIRPAMRGYEVTHPPKTQKEAEARAFYEYVGQPQLAFKYDKPEIPEGYEVAGVKEVTYTPVPLTAKALLQPSKTELEVELKPKEVYAPTQLFGPKTEYYSLEQGKFVSQEIGYGKAAKKISYGSEKGMSLMESQAITGLGLATITGTGLAAPKLGAFALGGVGTAEAVKFTFIGEHLTPEEAVSVAGITMAVGYGVMKAYPYAKIGYGKMVGKLSPERAMYNRVVAAQQAQQANAQNFMERFIGKVSPERAMYSRVVKEPTFSTKPADVITGYKGGGSSQWVQQQVLLKQAPLQKAPMKSFMPTLKLTPQKMVQIVAPSTFSAPKVTAKTKAAAKQQTSLIQVSMVRTSSQQVKNPFLQFAGKAYYKTKSKQEEITYPIVYPSQSPFASPISISKVMGLQGLRQSELQTLGLDLSFGQAQMPMVTTIQEQKQSQLVKQMQKVSQTMVSEQKQTAQLKIPSVPYIPLGGGSGEGRGARRLFGRWIPRRHKVKTWEQQLKTFGLLGKKGKVPKVFSRLSKAESFGDLGKIAKGSRKNVKITKILGVFGKNYKFGTQKRKRRKKGRKKR